MDVRASAPSFDSGEQAGADRVASVIDLLLCVSYIDGGIHPSERLFIDQYIDSVLRMIEPASTRLAWTAHVAQVNHHLSAEVANLALSLQPGAQLRARSSARFRSLAVHDQATALELITSLLHADGEVNRAEHDLQQELVAAFVTPAPLAAVPPSRPSLPSPVIVAPAVWRELTAVSHPLLDPIEQTLSPHPIERQSQLEWDKRLIETAILQWQRLRSTGVGRLRGVTDIEQIAPGSCFLDEFVHVNRPTRPVELIVLGDLHGCYSCLKAAVLQSDFIARVWAHQWDPVNYPEVKLVFLGDYIDRGRFSFEVLRAALHLFVSMPEHVVMLRGNHEWFRWFGQQISSAVYPAEGIASLAPYVPVDILEAYRILFEHMPTSLLVDRTMYVHAGIPRDDTFATKYTDLSSLNDPEIRFQMMWSDPVAADVIPVEMQRLNPRFPFGRHQFYEFMARTGMQTMIRGHEQIERGFEVYYDMGDRVLIDLFSAGGFDNADLPLDSSYRAVTPMAITVQHGQGTPIITPWPLHYRPFNFAPHNGLYRPQPLIEFKYF